MRERRKTVLLKSFSDYPLQCWKWFWIAASFTVLHPPHPAPQPKPGQSPDFILLASVIRSTGGYVTQAGPIRVLRWDFTGTPGWDDKSSLFVNLMMMMRSEIY